VVLLHGLTDSPYSLRHIARCYQKRGWTALGIRLPGHGTVPAALTRVTWPDWAAATRLAVREARRRAGGRPLHIVGFSNGGALALDHAIEAVWSPALTRPDRVILLSPMIGITAFARSPASPAGPPSSQAGPRPPGSGSCRSSIPSSTIRCRSTLPASPTA
jgi:alpha-beta hydrolase superfamily lysophospholipase